MLFRSLSFLPSRQLGITQFNLFRVNSFINKDFILQVYSDCHFDRREKSFYLKTEKLKRYLIPTVTMSGIRYDRCGLPFQDGQVTLKDKNKATFKVFTKPSRLLLLTSKVARIVLTSIFRLLTPIFNFPFSDLRFTSLGLNC